jgi:hypothetical protein
LRLLLTFLITFRKLRHGTGGVAQVVGLLPRKPEALSSNPTIVKKQKQKQKNLKVGCQWLTPVILATGEAKIRRIMV